jgi:hypothetical protein
MILLYFWLLTITHKKFIMIWGENENLQIRAIFSINFLKFKLKPCFLDEGLKSHKTMGLEVLTCNYISLLS